MKTVHVRCMSLPKGVPVPHLDTLAEAKDHVKGDENKIVDLLNKYGRQKDSLVNAREYISQEVDKTGFKIHDRKTGKPLLGNDKDEPETDTDHLERFVTASVAGKASAPGLTVTGKDDKEKIKSVWAYLQTIVDKHGPFPFDLNQKARVGKVKNPPVWAKDAATSIINGGAKKVAEWTDRFTNGYESKGFGRVGPIEFSDFDQVAPKGASAEDVEKVKTSNINNLAWAIVAAEEFKRAATAQKEYV